jgi:hypothetical protein
VHHVVLPIAFVVAPVLEDVLPLAMLQSVFLLADELVAVSVLLVNVFQLFVFGFLDDDGGGEDSIG